ncbi:hypothetical protein [Mesorhizobium sp.]|nr:hypothetical protein [Mesorhizobium sp.]
MATDIIAKMAAEATTKATAKLAEIELAAKIRGTLDGSPARRALPHRYQP